MEFAARSRGDRNPKSLTDEWRQNDEQVICGICFAPTVPCGTVVVEFSLSCWYDGCHLPKDYCDGVMQDDVCVFAVDGWREKAKPRGITENRRATAIAIKLRMMRRLLAGLVRLVTLDYSTGPVVC